MKKTAIIFHGFNAEVYTNLSAHGAFLMKSGFNVLFVTHRSHGKSEGRWSTIGLREQNDVLSWVKWAENRGAAQILLYGVSMGGFTVAGASDRLEGTKVRSMVIDSGFYSVYEQMKRDSKKTQKHPHSSFTAPTTKPWSTSGHRQTTRRAPPKRSCLLSRVRRTHSVF